MGLTSSYFATESCEGQSQYDPAQCKGIDLPDSVLKAVTFYVQSLAVPAARDVKDADVGRGRYLFSQAKCAACHRPEYTTSVNVAFKEISYKRIRPYTDLLLHDMGPDLADNRPDYLATGNEWRTTPLWGVGLLQRINGNTLLLHDGRARSVEEAILWHGGEAEGSKQYFINLSKQDRNALIKFVNSL
jgi:CxxC motif-containing protein (DUF1111 family)